MADSPEEMVTFRLGPKDRAAIQKLVDEGEFRNRSDFLRYAVKAGLREFDPRVAKRLDMDLEGVDLPAHDPVRARPGARARRGMGQ